MCNLLDRFFADNIIVLCENPMFFFYSFSQTKSGNTLFVLVPSLWTGPTRRNPRHTFHQKVKKKITNPTLAYHRVSTGFVV